MDIARIDIDSCAPTTRQQHVFFRRYHGSDRQTLGVKAETLYDWRRAERLYARLDSSVRAASESMWTKIKNYANLAKAQGLEEVWGTSANDDDGYVMVIQVSSRSGPEPSWTRRHVNDILEQATRLNRESSRPRSLVLTLEQSLELDADDERTHELAMRSRYAASMFCEAIKMRLDRVIFKDECSRRSSHTFLIVNEGRQHVLKYSNHVWDLCFDRIYACTTDAPIFRPFECAQ